MATPAFTTPTIGTGRPSFWNCNQVGTRAAVDGLIVTEVGADKDSCIRSTQFQFDAVSITITDALAYVGTKIYDFPEGLIMILAAVCRLTLTTTSTIASTLNSGVTVSFGFGSATASSATLATTMINVIPGTGVSPSTFTSSTTINVASAAVNAFLTLAPQPPLDGTATAVDLFFNLAVPTATDIDADATVAVNGYALVHWMMVGDPPASP